jgi:hypothetical protein
MGMYVWREGKPDISEFSLRILSQSAFWMLLLTLTVVRQRVWWIID